MESLELKSSITEMKYSLDGLKIRMEAAEEGRELEQISRNCNLKRQKQPKNFKKWVAEPLSYCRTVLSSPKQMLLWHSRRIRGGSI